MPSKKKWLGLWIGILVILILLGCDEVSNRSKATVSFDSRGGTEFAPMTLDYGSNLDGFVPTKENHIFVGWYGDESFTERLLFVPSFDVTVYALWLLMPEMVQVGEVGKHYTMPTGLGDTGIEIVTGGYFMASTETTYKLWFSVRIWAEANG